MNLKRMTLWACGLALVGTAPCPDVTAQTPVPVRLESEWTGYGNSNAIRAECDIFGEVFSSLRLTGGAPGCQAMLYCGVALAPTPMPTPFGDFFISHDCVVIGGVFDADGVFEIPLNLGMRELRGMTLYMQGMEITDVAPGPQLSWLLTLRFVEGNDQPPLGHHSPAMQAFFCRDVVEEEAVRHALLLRFEAAESYVLTVDKVETFVDKVKVYVTLGSIGGPSGANQWHREAFYLTRTASEVMPPRVEVRVRLDHGAGGPYRLAAVIDTLYGIMTP